MAPTETKTSRKLRAHNEALISTWPFPGVCRSQSLHLAPFVASLGSISATKASEVLAKEDHVSSAGAKLQSRSWPFPSNSSARIRLFASTPRPSDTDFSAAREPTTAWAPTSMAADAAAMARGASLSSSARSQHFFLAQAPRTSSRIFFTSSKVLACTARTTASCGSSSFSMQFESPSCFALSPRLRHVPRFTGASGVQVQRLAFHGLGASKAAKDMPSIFTASCPSASVTSRSIRFASPGM
mmetsp:Transcript_86419/g.152934  ORF Transcript_86419/g.152934 Transcript_86419/m.152934 type:complete len:242 (-) Transcript_86419:3266-3991(-)